MYKKMIFKLDFDNLINIENFMKDLNKKKLISFNHDIIKDDKNINYIILSWIVGDGE